MKKESKGGEVLACIAEVVAALAAARLGDRMADVLAQPEFVTGERPFGKVLSTKVICLN